MAVRHGASDRPEAEAAPPRPTAAPTLVSTVGASGQQLGKARRLDVSAYRIPTDRPEAGWVHMGIPRVKMKTGEDWGTKPEEDVARVRIADHARIERLLFDGVPQPIAGRLRPDSTRPGLGFELKCQDAEKWRIEV